MHSSSGAHGATAMATTDVRGFPIACELCEATGRPLFAVPDGSRTTHRAPRAVCRFCFIRIVGIVPRRRLRVDAPAPGQVESPQVESPQAESPASEPDESPSA